MNKLIGGPFDGNELRPDHKFGERFVIDVLSKASAGKMERAEYQKNGDGDYVFEKTWGISHYLSGEIA